MVGKVTVDVLTAQDWSHSLGVRALYYQVLRGTMVNRTKYY